MDTARILPHLEDVALSPQRMMVRRADTICLLPNMVSLIIVLEDGPQSKLA
jgi:hypothetical protein